MGRHSVRGVLTGEELDVVHHYSDSYCPRHSQEPVNPMVAAFEQVFSDMWAGVANIVPLRRIVSYEREYGDYGFGKTW